jgi:DNA polymerase III delta subunit
MILLIISESDALLEEFLKERIKSDIEEARYHRNFEEFFSELQRKNKRDLFGLRKIIILKGLEEIKEKEASSLAIYLKENPNDFIIVAKSEPLILLREFKKKNVDYEEKEVKIPRGKELERFLISTLNKYKIRFTPNMIKILIDNYKDNFDLLLNEIKKLSLYGGNLGKEEILTLLRLRTDIFGILNSLTENNWLLFLRHFHKYLQQIKKDEEFNNLFSFLSNSLLKIAIYKLKPQATPKGNPYFLSNLKLAAKKMDIKNLQAIIEALARTERKLKRFQIKIEDFPREVIYEIKTKIN